MCESSQSKKNTFSLKNFHYNFSFMCVLLCMRWEWDEDKDEKGTTSRKMREELKMITKKHFSDALAHIKNAVGSRQFYPTLSYFLPSIPDNVYVSNATTTTTGPTDRRTQLISKCFFFRFFISYWIFSFYWTILSVCFFFFLCFIVFAMHQLSNN